MNPQQTSSAGFSADEHDEIDSVADSMASESIYTRGNDEAHTDAKSLVTSVVSGFTNLEISFQKAKSSHSAAPLDPPQERRMSLYDDIERQITAKAGLEDDWEVDEAFEPVKVKSAVPSVAHSDTSQSSGRKSMDVDDERKGNGGGGSMARRRCVIAVFIVALLAAVSLIVVFVVLPRLDGDSATSSGSTPVSSQSSPVPPPANEEKETKKGTSEQTNKEGTVGEIDEETENMKPATEDDPGSDQNGGENENTSAEEQATQDANEAWGGIFDALSVFATQCEDSDETFLLDQIDRTCDYLRDNVPAQTIACRPEGAAWEICLSTCNNC